MTLKNCNNLISWKLIDFFQLIVLGQHQVFHVHSDSGGKISISGGGSIGRCKKKVCLNVRLILSVEWNGVVCRFTKVTECSKIWLMYRLFS